MLISKTFVALATPFLVAGVGNPGWRYFVFNHGLGEEELGFRLLRLVLQLILFLLPESEILGGGASEGVRIFFF